MTSVKHQFFGSPTRDSQSLNNDRCQNILYKAVFEQFKEVKWIAALLLASTSFQNSSFGANLVVNFAADDKTIPLLESVLSPSSCLSLQFVPSLHIKQSKHHPEQVNRTISNFVGEIVKTKYLHLQLRSLTLESAANEVISSFFESSTNNSWPQLQELTVKNSELNDAAAMGLSQNANQLRSLNLTTVRRVTDAGLEHLSNLSKITSLDLVDCETITDVGLGHLSNLAGITSLNIFRSDKITDIGLNHLSTLTGITTLNLALCNNITDVGIDHISKLSGITSLNLACCSKITDVGVEHISTLSDITSLTLNGCSSITDAGFEHLAELTNITFLDLSLCTKITDAGIRHITKLSGITSLDLCGCNKITDAGLEHIGSKLSNIKSLALRNCRMITDVGLDHLAKLSLITSLDLTGDGRISAGAKQKLTTALPKCTILDWSG